MLDKIIDIISNNIKNIEIIKVIDNHGNTFYSISKNNPNLISLEDLLIRFELDKYIISDVLIDIKTYNKIKREINKLFNESGKKEIRDSCDNRCIGL